MTNHSLIEIEKDITDYIKEHGTGGDYVLNGSTNFVESRLLDSFSILNLIMTLESLHKVRFEAQELADPNMQTIGTLARTIYKKITT